MFRKFVCAFTVAREVFLIYTSMTVYIKIDDLYIQFLNLYIIRKTINKMNNVVFGQLF